jgi:polyisoprenoid-binding protein YceI
MKTAAAALLLTLSASPALAASASYTIDPAHSQTAFAVRHLVISTVRGEFTKTEGTVVIDDADVTKSKVEAVISVDSVSTREVDRDKHLKSADFLDAAKFPTITFKSTKVEAAGAGALKVTGDLTLHGVTRSVVLDVTGPSAEITDPWKQVKRGIAASTKINRRDFGVNFGAIDTATPAVGDEVTIQIDAELTKAAPKK